MNSINSNFSQLQIQDFLKQGFSRDGEVTRNTLNSVSKYLTSCMKLGGKSAGIPPKAHPQTYPSGVWNLRGALFGDKLGWGCSWIFYGITRLKSGFWSNKMCQKMSGRKKTGWIVCFVYPDVCQVNWMAKHIRSMICVSFSSHFTLLATIIEQIGVKELAASSSFWILAGPKSER